MARVYVDGTLTSVWAESFTGRNGDEVEFYRALLSVAGEAPMQLSVSKDDVDQLNACVGVTGQCELEIDARPGNRARVYLKDVK